MLTVGCGDNNKKEKLYNSNEYAVVYVNGDAHFAQLKTNFIAKNFKGLVGIFEVGTNNYLTCYRAKNESGDEPIYSDELNGNTSYLSIYFLSDLVNGTSFNQETYDFFIDSEKANEYIDKNYQYDIHLQLSEKVSTDMKLYEYINEGEEINYHIGYNACLTKESDYIYDIIDNKIYRKPDLGTCSYVNVSELYSEKQITTNGAKELLSEYINNKSSKVKGLTNSK